MKSNHSSVTTNDPTGGTEGEEDWQLQHEEAHLTRTISLQINQLNTNILLTTECHEVTSTSCIQVISGTLHELWTRFMVIPTKTSICKS